MRQQIQRLLCALSMVTFLPATLSAHPHNYVDQQALLSLNDDEVQLRVIIVPSDREGKAIFDHLDANADGEISGDEALSFASDVALSSVVTLNEKRLVWTVENAQASERAQLEQGNGRIQIDASAAIDFSLINELRLSMQYSDFSHSWFIQAFYSESIMSRLPQLSVIRDDENARLTIRHD